MAWDGSGNFTRTKDWTDDRDGAIKILASRHDENDEELKTGIGACITKNNESKPTAHFQPNVNNTYDLGSSSLKWKKGYFADVVEVATPTAGGHAATKSYVDAAASNPFASGTKMLFQQTTAPTGWTKSTTHNNKALRVVSGTAGSGGNTAFTSVFGSSTNTGGWAINVAQMPVHSHGVTDPGHVHVEWGSPTNTGAPYVLTGGVAGGNAPSSSSTQTSVTGITINNAGSGEAHAHSLSLDLQYVDVIIATKD